MYTRIATGAGHTRIQTALSYDTGVKVRETYRLMSCYMNQYAIIDMVTSLHIIIIQCIWERSPYQLTQVMSLFPVHDQNINIRVRSGFKIPNHVICGLALEISITYRPLQGTTCGLQKHKHSVDENTFTCINLHEFEKLDDFKFMLLS